MEKPHKSGKKISNSQVLVKIKRSLKKSKISWIKNKFFVEPTK